MFKKLERRYDEFIILTSIEGTRESIHVSDIKQISEKQGFSILHLVGYIVMVKESFDEIWNALSEKERKD